MYKFVSYDVLFPYELKMKQWFWIVISVQTDTKIAVVNPRKNLKSPKRVKQKIDKKQKAPMPIVLLHFKYWINQS